MNGQMLGTPSTNAAPAAFGVSASVSLNEWRHSLVVLEGLEPGRRIELGDKPLVIGRRTAADLVLPELQVSGLHCRVQVEAGRPVLKITDLKSTNGSFINGRRISGSAYLAPGGTLAVGEHLFRHDFLSPDGLLRAAYEEAARDQTVSAWLPLPQAKGPVRTDWCYRPADPPRGAGFATLPLAGERVALVLIDVCGPREHVARHAAALLRELQEVTSLAGPAALFAQLHARWREVEHDGFFFTGWAAVYDPASRRLSHACAGQHAALLRAPDGEMQRLDALNPPVGLLPGTEFVEDSLDIAAGSRLYLFNRGAFDVFARSGRRLELDDFEALLACLPPGEGCPLEQAFAQVRGQAELASLEDDFLLMQAEFA
jgi:hypothetical protein